MWWNHESGSGPSTLGGILAPAGKTTHAIALLPFGRSTEGKVAIVIGDPGACVVWRNFSERWRGVRVVIDAEFHLVDLAATATVAPPGCA
jgi:hypothetical protein